MPAFLLELFSEEIPARMQARAADDLARLLGEALAPLDPQAVRTFHGPRRVALACDLASEVAAVASEDRGPRLGAPEAALGGFLRKHGAAREQLAEAGDYWVLRRSHPAQAAAAVIATAMPGLLRRFPWPKSMRWGGSSGFTWVRPLRRILCLLDGAVVGFDLRHGEDDGHGLAAAALTEGHRFLAPGAFTVQGLAGWQEGLRARRVMVDAAERRRAIAEGIAELAAARGLTVVEDAGLLDEVAGLVEWPVPLLGRIDAGFMDLPAEVMQVSMRVNQRYFALRTAEGTAAPWFGFAANIEAPEGNAAIVAGNERVLRARFADARHFWDLDRRTRLADRVAALDGITFHAKLGSQGDRVRDLQIMAVKLATIWDQWDSQLRSDAAAAAKLAKADLTTGMVGEFPELQGVMGRYYALHDNVVSPRVADAIREHYAPRGPSEPVPKAPLSIILALAEKLLLIVRFFDQGEQPTGSSDPYALRRAALGIIRILIENDVQLSLDDAINAALPSLYQPGTPGAVYRFIIDRLKIKLRGDGVRADVVDALPEFSALAASPNLTLTTLIRRQQALAAFIDSADGQDLLIAYRRADNILRIESKKDDPLLGLVDSSILMLAEEVALARELDKVDPQVSERIGADDFTSAMAAMARLRGPVDAFFDHVTVNAPEPALRANRLRLLARLRSTMDRVADFSRIQS